MNCPKDKAIGSDGLPAAARVAVAQMTSVGDQSANFRVCGQLAREAVDQGCKMLFLPECCSFIGLNQKEVTNKVPHGRDQTNGTWDYKDLQNIAHTPWSVSLQTVAVAQPLDGPLMSEFCGLAREVGIWLSLGGFQEVGPDKDHIYNTHVVLSSDGDIVASYRKVRSEPECRPEHAVLSGSPFRVTT